MANQIFNLTNEDYYFRLRSLLLLPTNYFLLHLPRHFPLFFFKINYIIFLLYFFNQIIIIITLKKFCSFPQYQQMIQFLKPRNSILFLTGPKTRLCFFIFIVIYFNYFQMNHFCDQFRKLIQPCFPYLLIFSSLNLILSLIKDLNHRHNVRIP
ncbi:hypothetical protein PPERSA_05879 [Pseudocohnilembus persalinus]|uniref:Transmembrane protein n=1 Tax=Pseudocohnilembus persalinus TaxID=266149 RepID=A0A0V0R486_PSEPJ|nr:hypothetical protein PPERSA_05879 [Pseudocohnilembus persalinus]|eukprot:KRX09210.1 hypothetical protein PPERSA_05879 [Pseudocohnilembus persalinus]